MKLNEFVFILIFYNSYALKNSRAFHSRPKPLTCFMAKGFSGSNDKSKSSKSSGGFGINNTNKKVGSQSALEGNIQTAINSQNGLREAMNLQNDIEEWKLLSKFTGALNDAPSFITSKISRLQELETSYGWTSTTVHNKIQEITWDSSASFRSDRHSTMQISSSIEKAMLELAQYCLPSGNEFHHILDVGCGDGILIQFLNKYITSTTTTTTTTNTLSNASKSKKCHSKFLYSYHGLDISNNMIHEAMKKHPYANVTFTHIDFLSYQNSIPINNPITTIVFNEVLHYFQNLEAVLFHAKLLLQCNTTTHTVAKNHTDQNDVKPSSITKRIILSHPKGFDNIILQRSQNKILVPNLLPTAAEISTFAQQLNMKAIVLPNTKSSPYLAVLEC